MVLFLLTRQLNLVVLKELFTWLFTTKSVAIGHVRYISIVTWLRDFQDKLLYLVLFSLYPSLFWKLRDKRNLKNLQFWPESLGAMLEYWYIERGVFSSMSTDYTVWLNDSLFNCKFWKLKAGIWILYSAWFQFKIWIRI